MYIFPKEKKLYLFISKYNIKIIKSLNGNHSEYDKKVCK